MSSASNTAPLDEPDAGMTGDPGSKLCPHCQGLGLQEGHFLLEPPKRTHARRVAHLNYQATNDPQTSESHSQPRKAQVSLPRLGRMVEKADDCVVCDIIWRAFHRYRRTKAQNAGPLYLAWELDGRRSDESNLLDHRTRRIRISWDETDGTQESFVLILLGSPRDHGDDCAFLGREEVSPEEKLDIMKEWIQVCAEEHNSSCGEDRGEKDEFDELVRSTYFGVIDVVDMQLKELPAAGDDTGRHAEYVALSYVWGSAGRSQGQHMTSKSNVMTRIAKDGLKKDWELFPKTIRDSMLLVRQMGLRYLWVDSLCIVQDSSSSWDLNARAMHLGYGNAHFTICAADGDATTGLRAVSEILSNVRTYGTRSNSLTPVSSPVSSYSTENEAMSMVHLPIGTRDTHEPLIIESPVRLLVSRSPEDVIRGSSWDKRGWTFQERLLSRRCLIFAEGLAYFECRSIVMSQDKFPDSSHRGWALDYAKSPLRTLDELKRKAFWVYMKCVRLYTGRHLTKPKDILSAFQGSSRLLNQYLKGPLLYGLPMSHFDLALLWTPVYSLCRRKKRFPRGHGSSGNATNWDEPFTCDRCSATDADFGETEFPTWSWCGWMDGKCEYELQMLEGCFPDVQEWLTKHTWIQWYVRDRDGNLRPLWDRFIRDEDISEDKRWRGYAGHDSPPKYPIRGSFPAPASGVVRTEGSRSGFDSQSEESCGPTGVDAKPTRPRAQTTGAVPATARRRSSNVERSRQSGGFQGEYSPHHGAIQGFSSDMNRMRIPEESKGEYSPRHRTPQRDSFTASRDSFTPGVEYPDPRRLPARQESPPGLPAPEPPPKFDRASMESETDGRIDPYLRTRGIIPGDKMIRTRDSSTTRSTQETETYDIPEVDDYGRPIRLSAKCGTDFVSLTPDNPFGVGRERFSFESGFNDDTVMPVLQFWTHQQDFRVSIQEQEDSNSTNNDICKCDIRNDNDDICGVIKLPRSYIEARADQETFYFVALSESKGFTKEEMPVWNNFITKEREDSEWDVYFVLLLERNSHRALWERVALGKVFKSAFKRSAWREIQLG